MKLKCTSTSDLWGDEDLYYIYFMKTGESPSIYLELGEVYHVKFHKWNHDTIGYLVELNGMTYYFNTNRFEDVDVSRDNKLNELLK